MIEEEIDKPQLFGLIGRNISYSFSKKYFNDKFSSLNLNNHKYQNFDLQSIEEFSSIIKQHPSLKGLNVTIPYKEAIINYLDEIEEEAFKIGAVNTIKINKDKTCKGFNTDVYGFMQSINPLLEKHHKKALILGTGGASKAIAYAFKKLQIDCLSVSRKPLKENQIAYKELSKNILSEYTIVVNCTPLGTFPEIDLCPNIPYQHITSKHLLYDLIYNPTETTFLRKGKAKSATVKNGLEMLQLQAEKSWQIWNR